MKDLKARPLAFHWQVIEQEDSQFQTLALARLEESVY